MPLFRQEYPGNIIHYGLLQEEEKLSIRQISTQFVSVNAKPDKIARITFNPDQCGGKPCVRGMRIRVVDVLELLENGLSAAEVLQELPDLEEEDIRACIAFARKRSDHPVLAV